VFVNQAHNLEAAILNLDPAQPLRPEEEAFYVERDHSERRDMAKLLRIYLQRESSYARFLFTGHRGAGKGTELYRLNKELSDVFCLVHFSVRDKLEVSDLDYRDVIFAIGMGIIEVAQKTETVSIPKKMLEPIINFFADIYEEKEFKAKFDTALEVKPTLFNILTGYARYGTERSTRATMRKQISGSLRSLINAIDDLARHIERAIGKKILVIIEDLDKTDPEKARELFFEHGQSLTSIPVHLIYTFPVALRHSQNFTQITAYFENFDLPNIKTHLRDDTPAASLQTLQEIITRRVAINLFEADALEELVKYSGGLVRSLISLANDACLQAILKSRAKVNLSDVTAAVQRARADYSRFLTFEQKDRLREIHKDKASNNSLEDQALLYSLSVLEYRNDDPEPWYDVHAIVQDLL
jgi:class 3 adenylate cyclase